MSNMFCFQCQESMNNTGCTVKGVCGKTAECASLQDALVKASQYAAKEGNKALDIQIMQNLFMTITNANFSNDDITAAILKTYTKKSIEELKAEGSLQEMNEDVRSLRELVMYGLKGMSAYMSHAYELGYQSEELFDFLRTTLATLLEQHTQEEYIKLIDDTGAMGVKAMALLDEANTSTYGNPEISEVSIEVGDRPGILVSGHDLHDLEILLEQSKDAGIDIYTHSEMLPAHYYPKFKQYAHFKGNYGNAWWKQQSEFESFNGVILMTTNCIVPVRNSYKDRIYTTGVVGYDGLTHIEKNADGTKDFTPLIEQAKTLPAPTQIETGSIIGGFAHAQVFALADKIIEAVKTGKIKKFIVMAGCDGRHTKRNYYTEFAKALPKDTVILTAGCAKYRYNKLNLGDIDGIPRVLDAGQCNDSYSLALIALKLKEVFALADVNDLPIVYNIAWYEQKAVIVLLALLHLGVKNIHLGPTLPAFISPNVAKFLVDNFGIGTINNVEDDMEVFGIKEKDTDKVSYADMTMEQLLTMDEGLEEVLENAGFYCLGCPSSQFETLKDACEVHGLELEGVLKKVEEYMNE